MNKRIAEIALMILVLAIFAQGLFVGVLLGFAVAITKKIFNKFTSADKHFVSPYDSVANGAAAGLILFLFKLVF